MPTNLKLIQAAQAATRGLSSERIKAIFRRPVIIVSAPRSGSNLLFEQLMRIRGFWTIGGESHAVFAAFPHLSAENAAFDSGCLDERHAGQDVRRLVRACFLCLVGDNHGIRYLAMPPDSRPETVQLLEKTPRNALNIRFMLKLFPDANFIYLYRDPRENLASIIEGWMLGMQTGRFVTFPSLPGWDREAWCFLLPPGWRSMIGKSLAEIAAFQWTSSNDFILDNLTRLPRARWTVAHYSSLVENPAAELTRLCRFAGVDPGTVSIPTGPLPLSRTAVAPPHPDKWKKHEQDIAPMLPQLLQRLERIRTCAASHTV